MTKYEMYQQLILANQRHQLHGQDDQIEVAEHQLRVMNDIGLVLSSIHTEMAQVRTMGLQGLAIQQELLARDTIQAQIEEFVYNIEKAVTEFRDHECTAHPTTRYFTLKGILETVKEERIGTPLIRGRDNKAAFEKAIESVSQMALTLVNTQEVKEALAWVAEDRKQQEQKRIEQKKEDEKRQEEENKRVEKEYKRQAAERKRAAEAEQQRRDEQEALRKDITARIEALQAQLPSVTFGEWYSRRIEKLMSKEAHQKANVINLIPYQTYLHIFKVEVVLVWLCYGFLWIPACYYICRLCGEKGSTLR